MKKAGCIFFIVLDMIFIHQICYAQISYEVFSTPPVDRNSRSFAAFCQTISLRPIIKGTFVLTKHEKGKIKKAPESGKVIIDGMRGFVLNNIIPNPFSVVLMENNFSLTSKRGFIFTLDNNKTLKNVFYSFRSVFEGEFSILLENFEVYFSEKDGGWTVGVVPKDTTIRFFMNSVIIKGDTDVRNVCVIKKNGDILEYYLTDHVYPESLTDEEAGYFKVK